MIKPDPFDHIDSVRRTLYYYKRVVDHCESHPNDAAKMEAELPVCKEMVALLPAKLDKMLSEAQAR